jgi:hypothetical protein
MFITNTSLLHLEHIFSRDALHPFIYIAELMVLAKKIVSACYTTM